MTRSAPSMLPAGHDLRASRSRAPTSCHFRTVAWDNARNEVQQSLIGVVGIG